MKPITSELQGHLAQQTTTLATCWRIQRTDDVVFTFTDFDQPITFWDEVYLPASGFRHSAVATNSGMNVDNLEVDSVLTSDTITDADLLAGVWDYARVEIFQVNWTDLTQDRMVLRSGTLGEVKTGRNAFNAELRGLTQPLQQSIGRVFGIACDANFADGRCGVFSGTYTFTGTVSSVTDKAHFTASDLTQASGYFDYGLLEFTSGLNSTASYNQKMEVRTYLTGGVITLQMPVPYTVAVGDTFEIRAGCDKTLATCISRFNNAVNFRGFPHIPGQDRLVTGN